MPRLVKLTSLIRKSCAHYGPSGTPQKNDVDIIPHVTKSQSKLTHYPRGACATPPPLTSVSLPFIEERQFGKSPFPSKVPTQRGGTLWHAAVKHCRSEAYYVRWYYTPVHLTNPVGLSENRVGQTWDGNPRQIAPLLPSPVRGQQGVEFICSVMHRGSVRDPALEPPGEISHRGRGSRHQR